MDKLYCVKDLQLVISVSGNLFFLGFEEPYIIVHSFFALSYCIIPRQRDQSK